MILSTLRNLLFVISTFLVLSSGNAQERTILSTSAECQISYTRGTCEVAPGQLPFEFGFIQVENFTNSPIEVGFYVVKHFQEGCDGCSKGDESYVEVIVPAQSTIITDCSSDGRLKVLFNNPNFKGSWHFLSLAVADVRVRMITH